MRLEEVVETIPKAVLETVLEVILEMVLDVVLEAKFKRRRTIWLRPYQQMTPVMHLHLFIP